MSQVTSSTIFTRSWNNIYDLINQISHPEGKDGKWIYSSFPQDLIEDKGAYPMIVVTPVNVSNEEYITLKTLRRDDLPVEIIIYSLRADQLDSLSETVNNKIKDNEDVLFDNNMKKLKFPRTSYSNVQRSGLRIHLRTMRYTFKFDVS